MTRVAKFGKLVFLFLIFSIFSFAAPSDSGIAHAKRQSATRLLTPPVSFEPNLGQTDAQVKFLSRIGGTSLFLTKNEVVFVLTAAQKNSVLRMKLLGANRATAISGKDVLSGRSNYLFGKDERKWRTDIPNYGRVTYRNIYPGIDLAYHGQQGPLEYDWIVRPGGDPARIRISFSGAQRSWIDGDDLVIATAAGELRNRKPVVYQQINGTTRYIDGHYLLRKGGEVSFRLGEYDRSAPLVIDPTLNYVAFLGGTFPAFTPRSAGYPIGPATDSAGNAYLIVSNPAADFPATGSIGPQRSALISCCFYAVKLNPSGNVVFSAMLGFLGGANGGGVARVTADSAGSIYITGLSGSDLPVTTGALQKAPKNTSNPLCSVVCSPYLLKLNASGSGIVYATFLGGGSSRDETWSVKVDATGSAYLTGFTTSTDFSATMGALNTCGSLGGLFVAKMNPVGTSATYSACIGGTFGPSGSGIASQPWSIATDSAGNAYVAGSTTSPSFPTTQGSFQPAFGNGNCSVTSTPVPCPHSFIFKLNGTGSAVLYSTFLEAASQGSDARGIAVDSSGNTYITGKTNSPDFPTTPGVVQPILKGNASAANVFVTKLNPAGSSLVYSTYVGGSAGDIGLDIAIDSAGNAFVTGYTTSPDFPQANPIQAGIAGGDSRQCLSGQSCPDAIVFKLNSTGTALDYSTYFGGGGVDEGLGVAVDAVGNAYVTGIWESAPPLDGLLYSPGVGKLGSFLIKLVDPGASMLVTLPGLTNAASFVSAGPQSGLAPGIISLFGSNITNVNGILTANSLPLPTELGGTSVLVNGKPVPIFAVANVNGQQQINFQLPADAAPPCAVTVINNGTYSVPLNLGIATALPGIFTVDGVRGAILHGSNFQPVTVANPAAKGESIVIYATGMGPVQPDPGTGNPASGSPLSVSVNPTSVTIGGAVAQVLYSGLAPGFVGLNQVNATVPADAPSGDVEVVVKVTVLSFTGSPLFQNSSKPVKLAVQ